MRTVEEIVAIYGSRSQASGGVKARMRNLRDYYNGDVIVPLPELNSDEQSAVANLLAQGLDQTAMRIASTRPDIFCPPTDPTKKRARDNAAIRRKAIFGWWENSRMDLQIAKRARQLIGYATTITQLRFNADKGVPEWHSRDPLTAYPATLLGVDDMRPRDVVFAYERPLGYLRSMYPETARMFQGDSGAGEDQAIEMIEYVSAEEQVLIAMRGPVKTGLFGTSPNSDEHIVAELERTPNDMVQTPVVCAQRISLDYAQGHFDGILGR